LPFAYGCKNLLQAATCAEGGTIVVVGTGFKELYNGAFGEVPQGAIIQIIQRRILSFINIPPFKLPAICNQTATKSMLGLHPSVVWITSHGAVELHPQADHGGELVAQGKQTC
jgi:hypothetical protein